MSEQDLTTKSNWNEYYRLVISELERLNRQQEAANSTADRLSTKIDDFRNEITQRLNTEMAPIKADIIKLHEDIARQSVHIEQLQKDVAESNADAKDARKAARTALIGVVTGVIVGLLVWYVTHASLFPAPAPSKPVTAVMSRLVSGDSLDRTQ